MRYKSINLAAFGPFTDYQLEFSPNPDFHIIYGPNEAGKTSALRALIQVLYGIPMQSSDNHLHDYRKLRIGVELENENQSLAFIRRKRNINPIIDPQTEEPINEELLNQFLANRNQNFFEKVYGLDHQRLRQGGQGLLSDDGELGLSIFSAATGDIGKLQSIKQTLEASSKELFSPTKRGKGQLNQALTEYKAAEKEANDLMLRSRDWEALETEYLELKQEKAGLDRELESLEKSRSKLSRIQRCAPLVTKLETLTNNLKDLGDVVELDLAAIDQRETFERQIDKFKYRKKSAQDQLSKLVEETATITVPKTLLLQADQIQDLVERLDSYRSNLNSIPTLTAQVNQLKNQAFNLMQELDPSKKDLEDSEQLRISFATKATLKQLSQNLSNISDQLDQKQTELREWIQEFERIQEEEQELANNSDPSSLKALVKEIHQTGKLETEITDNHLDQAQLEVEIKASIQQLGLWKGSYLELLSLAVPQTETAVKYQQNFGELDDEIKDSTQQLQTCEQRLQEEKTKLANIESQKKVPTDQELTNARDSRDQIWLLLKRVWVNGEHLSASELEFTQGSPLENIYEDSVKSADLISDQMYQDAHNVGQKQALVNVIKGQEQNHKRLIDVLSKLKKQRNELLESWNLLWQDSQIMPRSPAEMIKWLEMRQEILARVTQLEQLEVTGKQLRDLRVKYINALYEQLSALGFKPDQNNSLAKLLGDAETVIHKIDQQNSRRQFLADERDKITTRISKIERTVEELEQSLKHNQGQWTMQLAQTKLPKSFDWEVIVPYLEQLDELFRIIDKYQAKLDQLKHTKNTVNQYQTQVRELVELCNPDLKDQPELTAIKQLDYDLKQGKADQVKQEQLEKQIQEQKEIIDQSQRELTECNQQLNQLIVQAQVGDLEQLKEAEARFKTHLELSKAINDLENSLLEEGQGKNLSELKTEVKLIDPDLLPSKIEAVTTKTQAIRDQRDQKLTQLGDVEARYNEQVLGNNDSAMAAAQHQAAIMATIKDKAADFLQYRLSLGLLRKSIEIYRDQNQGSIIGRASDIFAKLTLGSFSGLRVDVDEKASTVILGVRPDGDQIGVGGMSDGTLDQLFLALRLAIIEEQVSDNAPLPLILDDVLINFDDQRSLATLEVLAELATKTQIIFFTHHFSLVELAAEYLANKVVVHHLAKNNQMHPIKSG